MALGNFPVQRVIDVIDGLAQHGDDNRIDIRDAARWAALRYGWATGNRCSPNTEHGLN